jgi:uncharacterized membrane protein
MSWKQLAIVCALGIAPAAEAAPGAGQDLAAEVRGIFEAKCARCHGPQLAKPRSGFGHVLDLRRLAADPDKVVPLRPDESGLWQQIDTGEMPPPNSPDGSLSALQKETIRAWIAAGAPAEGVSQSMESQPESAPSPSVVWRALLWLGKFHLLLVHFPIALLVAAAVAEGWSLWLGSRVPGAAARFCLGLGAVSAVPVVVLGWIYAAGGHGSPRLVDLHGWVGTAAGAWALVTAFVSERDARRGIRRWPTRILLLAGVLLVGVAAHLGGLMVHGSDFYDW